MKKYYSLLLTLLLTCIIAVPAAFAGVTDSPKIRFSDGSKSKHVFSVPGVIAAQGNLETVFICTSLEKKKTINIGVEVFDKAGGDPLNDISLAGVLDGAMVGVAAGETVTFETAGSGITATVGDVVIDLNAAVVDQGSARIVSTGKIMCSAMIMSSGGTPPTSMVSLQVIAKTKQKGN